MLLITMIGKVIGRREFFIAFNTFEMDGLLMLMKNNLVRKKLITVKAKRPHIFQASFLAAHYKLFIFK